MQGEKSPLEAFSGVVATSHFLVTGYQAFAQVRVFIPQTRGIYSPSLATTLVATFWLPTGYHPKAPKCGVSSDVGTRVGTRWTRAHESEKWELLSGNDGSAHFPS